MPLLKKTCSILSKTAPIAASSSSYFTLKPSNIQEYFSYFPTNFPTSSSAFLLSCFCFFGVFCPFKPDSDIPNQLLNTKKHCLIDIIGLFYLATGKIRVS